MERAKFKQWQASTGIDDYEAAAQGTEQAQHAEAAEFKGAHLPQWPILLDITHRYSLNTLLGPSIHECHPYLTPIPGTHL
eukprot:3422633-Rhodomonas_salina.1